MELKRALEHRSSTALTPYKPEAWEALLSQAGLSSTHSGIVDGLRHGFKLNFPIITTTQAPPNRPSIEEFKQAFNVIIAAEFAKGRYLGPFSRTELEDHIGPFQSSPCSIIPKPGRSGKYRILQNYSFPYQPCPLYPNPSINSQIDSQDFPTFWGTFSVISLLISRLPPGSQAATRDVAEAYRTIPLHFSQWPAAVVRIDDDNYGMDTATCFGTTPSAGIYGSVRDCGADIIRSQGIGPLTPWVDDHVFFRIRREFLAEYNSQRHQWHQDIITRGRHQTGGRLWFGGHIFEDGTLDEFTEDCRFDCTDLSGASPRSAEDLSYCYNFDDIDRISYTLGIPWEKTKDKPFGFTTTYLGFLWDLSTSTVALGTEKKAKYLQEVRNWQSRPTHSRNDVERMYGKLLHVCNIMPQGRAYITTLEAMLGLFTTHPFASRSAVKGTSDDMEWWASILLRPTLQRPIPKPVKLKDVGAFSDASSGVGIAIIVRGQWRAWRLIPGWETLDGKRDIAWAEAIGFECLVRFFSGYEREPHNFTIYGDNKGVVEGWWNGRSKNRPVNDIFRRIHQLSISSPGHSYHTRYIPSKDNPADGPSRGKYPPTSLLLPPIPLSPELERFVIDSQLPLTPIEQQHLREGRYPKALTKCLWNNDKHAKAGLRFEESIMQQTCSDWQAESQWSDDK
jgi:hypothetical protein